MYILRTLFTFNILYELQRLWWKWLRAWFGFANHLVLMHVSYPRRGDLNPSTIWTWDDHQPQGAWLGANLFCKSSTNFNQFPHFLNFLSFVSPSYYMIQCGLVVGNFCIDAVCKWDLACTSCKMKHSHIKTFALAVLWYGFLWLSYVIC